LVCVQWLLPLTAVLAALLPTHAAVADNTSAKEAAGLAPNDPDNAWRFRGALATTTASTWSCTVPLSA